jgi:hypothetical protein
MTFEDSNFQEQAYPVHQGLSQQGLGKAAGHYSGITLRCAGRRATPPPDFTEDIMILTAENCYSKEASMEYMDASQFKKFAKCEVAVLAEIRGEYSEEMTTSLLVGSYVDAYFDGQLDLFKAKHPEIFTRQGTLKSDFKQAEYIIQRIEKDEYFMWALSGERQAIVSGEIAGVPFGKWIFCILARPL